MNPDLDALPVAFIDKAFKAQLALWQLAPQLTVLFWSENALDGFFGHCQAAVSFVEILQAISTLFCRAPGRMKNHERPFSRLLRTLHFGDQQGKQVANLQHGSDFECPSENRLQTLKYLCGASLDVVLYIWITSTLFPAPQHVHMTEDK